MVGGFLDAYAFLAHGVFANAQTGNITLMAINIAESEWTKALGHLLPIVTFTAAALIVTLLNHRWEQHHPHSSAVCRGRGRSAHHDPGVRSQAT